MSRNLVLIAGHVIALLGALSSSVVHAQSKGFAINRFDTAEHGSDWFAGESLDLRGKGRPALGLTLDYGHKPLVIYEANGDERAAIVAEQLYAHVGGALVLADRVRFGVNLPIALWQDGESGTFNGMTLASSSRTAVGDLRLAADVRLLGEYGDVATLAVGLQVHLPTGDQQAFTGDGKVRLVLPRLMLAGDISSFAYSTRVGFNYRAQDGSDVPTGSELSFVAAAGLRVANKKLLLGPELWGTTVISGGNSAFAKETTPFELIFGGHYKIPNVLLSLGVGPGLTRGLGAPAVRVLASVEWMPDVQEPGKPAEEPSDRDGDGIVDDEDACPNVPGVASEDEARNGCPVEAAPKDRDHDGIVDAEDACPDDAGVENDDPDKNGCPPDRDGDGVLDADDACPDTKGVKSRDRTKNGCPGDRDGDGIVDHDDACPDQPGETNSDPEKNGCPAARIESGQIKILERIEFQTNSAQIVASSDPILGAVRTVLSDHPEIASLSIEGHTDNVGKAKYNQQLSQRRTEAVVKWLVKHGIDRSRLTAHGFGMSKPLESNDTAEGRDHNRRVEFHIRQANGKTVGDADSGSVSEEN